MIIIGPNSSAVGYLRKIPFYQAGVIVDTRSFARVNADSGNMTEDFVYKLDVLMRKMLTSTSPEYVQAFLNFQEEYKLHTGLDIGFTILGGRKIMQLTPKSLQAYLLLHMYELREYDIPF